MKKAQWNYECECGFKLSHTVAQVPLSEEVIIELLTKGHTTNKVEGFTSKTGNLFDAHLKYEDDKIVFDFTYEESNNENAGQQVADSVHEDVSGFINSNDGGNMAEEQQANTNKESDETGDFTDDEFAYLNAMANEVPDEAFVIDDELLAMVHETDDK